MNNIKNYQIATILLIEEFYNKYYNDDNLPISENDYYIVWDWKISHSTVSIADDSWSMDEIFCALYNNIEQEIILKYNSDKLDYYMEWLDKDMPFPNLYHYYKKVKVK